MFSKLLATHTAHYQPVVEYKQSNSVRITSSQNVVLVRLQIALKSVDQRIFQLFSGTAEKVVWRLLVRHSADYFVPYDYQGHVRTAVAELTTGWTQVLLADVVTRGRSVNTPSPLTGLWRHGSDTMPSCLTCRSAVCRRPVATPRVNRRRANSFIHSFILYYAIRQPKNIKNSKYINLRLVHLYTLHTHNMQKLIRNQTHKMTPHCPFDVSNTWMICHIVTRTDFSNVIMGQTT